MGSHALALHLATWSAATIRNELATLVEVGYLLQPHTSAGRVPSDRGYRYYVDYLMQEEGLPGGVRRQLEPRLAVMPADIEGVLELAAQVLAVAVDALSIVTGPLARRVAVKHLDLVSLDPGHALLILVLDGNVIRQHPMALSREADQEELSRLASGLNAEIVGLDGVQIESSQSGHPVHPLRSEVVADIAAFLHSVESREDTLIVHRRRPQPPSPAEFGDVQRLAQVLELVEEERVLGELLAAAFEEAGPGSDRGSGRGRRAHRASGHRGDRHQFRHLTADRLQPGADHVSGRRGEGWHRWGARPDPDALLAGGPAGALRRRPGWRSGDPGTELTMSADRGDRG